MWEYLTVMRARQINESREQTRAYFLFSLFRVDSARASYFNLERPRRHLISKIKKLQQTLLIRNKNSCRTSSAKIFLHISLSLSTLPVSLTGNILYVVRFNNARNYNVDLSWVKASRVISARYTRICVMRARRFYQIARPKRRRSRVPVCTRF